MEEKMKTDKTLNVGNGLQPFKSSYKGWMVLFLLQMIVGSVLSFAYSLFTYEIN